MTAKTNPKQVRAGLRAFGSHDVKSPYKTYGTNAFEAEVCGQVLKHGKLVNREKA